MRPPTIIALVFSAEVTADLGGTLGLLTDDARRC